MIRPALLLLLAVAAVPAPVAATELCRTHRKTLVVREQCKLREEPIDVARQVALGMEGPAGPSGPTGPSTGDLRLVDANDAETGLVLQMQDYYGQFATVMRSMTLPGSSGPEFVRLSMQATGLRQADGCPGDLFENATCTGPVYADCDAGECSSVGGAFFFRDVTGDPERGACFVGDPSEYRRSTFHRRRGIRTTNPAQVATICQALGGTLTEPAAACGGPRPLFCGACCILLPPNRGAIPVHDFDPALLGTPPFRLAR